MNTRLRLRPESWLGWEVLRNPSANRPTGQPSHRLTFLLFLKMADEPSRPAFYKPSRIVAEVKRRLSVVDELEATVSANLQRATRLRQSILQKAFSGELA